MTTPLRICLLQLNDSEYAQKIDLCARSMASMDPWVTLKRGYDNGIALLSDPNRELYLAEADGVVQGFMILAMKGAFVGYLQTICVFPAYQGSGVGRQLIAFAEQRIFCDVPNVFLCVSSFNPNARRLYERLGYAVIGELNDYIVSGHSEILMRKSIGPLSSYTKKAYADFTIPPQT